MKKISNSSPLPLTTREMQILLYIADGTSSKVIARELCISIQTVNNHRKNMIKKMDVKNCTELVRRFIQKVYEERNSY